MNWRRPWKDLPAWVALLFGVVGIVSLILTLLFNLVLNRTVLRLEMARTSYIPFAQQTLATPSGHTVQVQVLFDGQPVDGLQQMVFAVRNAGNGVVTHSSNELLYVEFPKTVTLLTADLGGTPEGDVSFGARVVAEEQRVYIDFAQLKRHEEFSLSVFFIGDLGSETPRLKGRSLATLATVVRLGADRPTTGVGVFAGAVAVGIFGSLLSSLLLGFALARRAKAEAQEAELRKTLGEISSEMQKLIGEMDKALPKLGAPRVGGVAGRDPKLQEPPTGQSKDS